MRVSLMLTLSAAMLALALSSAFAAGPNDGNTRDRQRDGNYRQQPAPPAHAQQLPARYGQDNGRRQRDGRFQAQVVIPLHTAQLKVRIRQGNGNRKHDGACQANPTSNTMVGIAKPQRQLERSARSV